MKKIQVRLGLLSVLLILLLLPFFASCSKDTVKDGYFTYHVNDDGTYTLIDVKSGWDEVVEVPSEVDGHTVVGIWDAFGPCYAKKIILPNTITYITEGFNDCYELEELDIPDSVIRIGGDKNFEDCPKLVQVEDGFSYVDNWVVDSDPFALFPTLRPGTVGSCDDVSLLGLIFEGNITFPDEFCYFGEYAFDNRHNSRTIEGTLTVNEIKTHSFVLKNVTVGKLVIKKSVYNLSSFIYDSKIGELVLNGELLTEIEKNQGDMTEAQKITVVGGSFAVPMAVELECKELVIGAGVSSICASAFESSTLESIVVEGNTVISQNAFAKCKAVKEFTGPAGALLGMDTGKLVSLTVTEGEISAELLSGARSLESLTVLPGVTVAAGALSGCGALNTATVPLSVVAELPKANLKHLTLSDGKVLGEGQFAGFAALESITLPAGLLSVGADAFLEAESLADVYFGGTVAEWASVSFAGGAANPMVHAECLYVGGALVTEALNLAALSPYAFYGCESLVAVSFVSGLTTIPEGAFAGCVGLTSLTIPASVRLIGKNAFGGCTGLAFVTFGVTSGWYRYESAAATNGTILYENYLTNPTSAVQYLTDTYKDYLWKRPNA